TRALVFDHEYDGALIQSIVPGRHPAPWVAGLDRVCRVEARLETVRVDLFELYAIGKVPNRRQYDFRSKGQRSDHRPRRNGAIVGPVRDAARHIVEKLPFNAIDFQRGWPWPIARRDPPAILIVEGKLE